MSPPPFFPVLQPMLQEKFGEKAHKSMLSRIQVLVVVLFTISADVEHDTQRRHNNGDGRAA